ncbi:MAG TPA: hypothetical protein VIJ82_09250 [Streptosporangiaceae bacterium]
MTGQPVLGDFLTAAHRHLASPLAWTATAAPGRDIEEVTSSLLRLITIIGRYTSDITTAFGDQPDRDAQPRGTWSRAAIQTLDDLASASATLAYQNPTAQAAAQATSILARRIDAAAISLTAGRDLLHTHFTPHLGGRYRHRSTWSAVIASPPVSRALLADLTSLAARTASLGTQIPAIPGLSTSAAEGARRLRLACHWLQLADAPARTAHQRDPVPGTDRELLHAIPASALPPRRIPDPADPVPGLCAAIIATAQRAGHAAWTAAGTPPGSPAISIDSWRKIAAASTATSHNCYLLLTTLADSTAQHGQADATEILKPAAAAAWLARGAWLRSARRLDEVTTDVRWRISRAAAEATDLTLLTGRLAYADPAWTLATGPAQPARPAASLTPAASDIPHVIAAVHHASESLALLAIANLEQARGAARHQRILIPVRSGTARPGAVGRFAHAPRDRTRSLGVFPLFWTPD